MASRKKSSKGTRGGSSGRGNPRNDGRITEEQHEEAMRVLRAEYYQGVRGIAEELGRRVKDGEIRDQNGFEQAVHEAVDGSYWVIYTHANFQVLLCSDNHDAYSEDFGEPPVSGSDINWAALAFAAMRRDVDQQISAEGIEPDWSDLDESPRRSGGRISVGMRVSGDDDTGVVHQIRGNDALVGWDSGVSTWTPVSSLRPTSERHSGGRRMSTSGLQMPPSARRRAPARRRR